MFKKMAIVVAVVIVAFLAFVATRPDSYRVERDIEIAVVDGEGLSWEQAWTPAPNRATVAASSLAR